MFQTNTSQPTYFSMREAPSMLGLLVGRNKFMQILREHRILDSNNQPMPYLVTLGYFKTKTTIKHNRYIFSTPLVTLEGLAYIQRTIPADVLNDLQFIIVDDEGNPVNYQANSTLNFYLNE